jgi:16S rRNA (cytidine1402-2'-O)-methyltransferase
MGMTAIVYESPHRIAETLADLGDHEICVARELTKHNEEFLRGPAARILETLRGTERMRGEFTIVLPPAERQTSNEDWIEPMVRSLIAEGVHTRSIAAAIASVTGWPKKKAYALVLSLSD